MERAKKLTTLWSYLPTFRFVAEEQHVGRAAKKMGLSPSAVSRAVGELEAALGHEVFTRRGRRLELNTQGERLLEVVREAMRRVHDGVTPDTGLVGNVVLGADEPYLSQCLPTLLQKLARLHPGITPIVSPISSLQIDRDLLRGDVDVAFGSSPRRSAELESVKLCDFATGVYVRSDHPDARASRLPSTLEYVDVPSMSTGALLGSLGARAERRVVASDVGLAAKLCLSTGFAALLPDAVALALGRGKVVRLAFDTPPIHVSVLTRRTIGPTLRIAAVVEVAKKTIA